MAPENLPHSWRGYDAADEVVGPSAGAPPFARDQQTALIQWRGVHALEVTGGSPSVSAPDMSATLGEPARLAVLGLMLYILAIAAVGFTLTRTRGRSLMLYPAVGLLVVAGSAAALAAGRVGPGTDVHIQQSVVVQQLPGTASSLILLRGVAEFPAFDTVELRALGADGAVETGESSDRAGVRYDENGAPLLSAGPVGLGARKAFELEAVVDFEALVALRDGRLVRVSNRSQHALDDCQFPAGFSKTRVGSLEPGQSVEAERRFAGGEATFTCSLAVPVVEFAAAHGNVRSDGTAVVMLQLPGDNRP